ncbi:small multi-drug export protein [Candidatus Uhrbacteria bacterium]|nr:small multi-drug export protein [Candidatus Uhrbacteria bacterium]
MWKILLIAALPIVELRGALPIALAGGMPFWQAYLLSVIGNLVPAIPLFFFLAWSVKIIERYIPFLHRWLLWWFERTRKKFGPSYERYGAVALCIFVAIPLPLTGAWSGAVAAVLFGIPARFAIPAIVVGVAIAGIIVGILTDTVMGVL